VAECKLVSAFIPLFRCLLFFYKLKD